MAGYLKVSHQIFPQNLIKKTFQPHSLFARFASTSSTVKEVDKGAEHYPEIGPQVDASLIKIDRGPEGTSPPTFTRYDGEVYDEERIARDVSRMYSFLRCKMAHVNKPEAKLFKRQHTIDYLRMEYAKFGRASGINPGLLWPSREEIAKMEGRETDLKMPTLQESWKRLAEKKKAAEEAHRKRQEEVDRNMAKMPEEIAKFHERTRKAEETIAAEKAKRTKLMEEAKEILGYQVDPKDPRFHELIEAKEREAKKSAKQEKKKQKEAKHLATLQSGE